MQIVVAALSGGVLATLAAAGTLALHPSWISRLVSFAVGALLGAVFLELLPQALETGSAQRVMVTVLGGLLAFFLLEKLVLWRHAHGHDVHRDDAEETEHQHALHAHGVDQGRSGLMILIGTSVHNFCDGVVIAAAFLASTALGIADDGGDRRARRAAAGRRLRGAGPFRLRAHQGVRLQRRGRRRDARGRARRVRGARRHETRAARRCSPLPRRACCTSRWPISFRACTGDPSRCETVKQLLLIGLGIGVIATAHVALEH